VLPNLKKPRGKTTTKGRGRGGDMADGKNRKYKCSIRVVSRSGEAMTEIGRISVLPGWGEYEMGRTVGAQDRCLDL